MSDAKQSVFDLFAEKKSLKPTDLKVLDAVLRRVGWVESKNNPEAVQESGGPGRGEFQFELGASMDSLKTRLKNFESTYGAVKLSEADRKALEGGDMSKVSKDGQEALTLVDWTMKTPGDEVGDLARGAINPKYFWAQFHWAGDEKELPKKLAQWDREMADYERMGYGKR